METSYWLKLSLSASALLLLLRKYFFSGTRVPCQSTSEGRGKIQLPTPHWEGKVSKNSRLSREKGDCLISPHLQLLDPSLKTAKDFPHCTFSLSQFMPS